MLNAQEKPIERFCKSESRERVGGCCWFFPDLVTAFFFFFSLLMGLSLSQLLYSIITRMENAIKSNVMVFILNVSVSILHK